MENNKFINNTVVEALNRNQAGQIIDEYIKAGFGFGCGTTISTKSLSDGNGCRYIGVIDNKLGNYNSTIFYEKIIKKLTLNELIARVSSLNKLPEKWYIRGCDELGDYLKTVDNNQHKYVGLDSEYSYYIDNNEIWECTIYRLTNHTEITLQQYLDSIKPNNNNINTNKMKSIEIPGGYEINLQKLIDLGIVTKPVQEETAKTYDDVLKTFKRQIASFSIHDEDFDSIHAFIKLLNTAKYLNNIYPQELNYHFYFYISKDELFIRSINTNNYNSVMYFNSKEAIEKAKEILGEETIKLALKFN